MNPRFDPLSGGPFHCRGTRYNTGFLRRANPRVSSRGRSMPWASKHKLFSRQQLRRIKTGRGEPGENGRKRKGAGLGMLVDALIWPTLLTFMSGILLCAILVLTPGARRTFPFQCGSWLYMAAAVGLYWTQMPSVEFTSSAEGRPANWLYLLAFSSYVPALAFLCYSMFEAALDGFLARVMPERSGHGMVARRLQRRQLRGRRKTGRGVARDKGVASEKGAGALGQRSWRQRFYRGRERRLIARKLREVRRDPENPVLRGDLIDLHLRRGELDRALYHAYAQVAFLPNGPAHAHALYRIAQIHVDHLGDLESAQPYLRRIIRSLPQRLPCQLRSPTRQPIRSLRRQRALRGFREPRPRVLGHRVVPRPPDGRFVARRETSVATPPGLDRRAGRVLDRLHHLARRVADPSLHGEHRSNLGVRYAPPSYSSASRRRYADVPKLRLPRRKRRVVGVDAQVERSTEPRFSVPRWRSCALLLFPIPTTH